MGEQEEENTSNLSALRENIISKGRNSYYYAHGTSRKHEWDGNEAPRLLSRDSRAAVEGLEARKAAITNYQWSDESEKVKIYIPFEGIGELSNESIEMNWEEKRLQVSITDASQGKHILDLKLWEEITNAAVKRKSAKLIVTLTKKDAFSWHTLKG